MISSIVGIGQGLIGGAARRQKQREKQAEFDKLKSEYAMQDISNVYSGMQNTMEDLTVNTQAAEFQSEMNQQSLSNIMNSQNRAAGGSGIAALAAAMANQQTQSNRSISADIGRQEQMNQMAERQEAGKLQSLERQGELMSRQAQNEILGTQLGMAGEELAAANQARQNATSQLIGGIGGVVGAIAGGGVIGGKFGEGLKKVAQFGQKTA